MWARDTLAGRLLRAAPEGLTINTATIVAPGLEIPLLVRRGGRRGVFPHPASDVVLVVEVVSAVSQATDDRVDADALAAAGIPHFWLVELDPSPTLTTHTIDGERYRPTGRYNEGEVTLTEPYEVKVELAGLALSDR
jgi:hypothetical protein